MYHFLLYFLLSSFLLNCNNSQQSKEIHESRSTKFSIGISRGEVEYPALLEVSGMVVSRSDPGLIWVHNDSGDLPRLFLIDTNGKHKGIFHIEGAKNRDWEDIAIGPGPVKGVNYIYIADIGDNNSKRDIKKIYRIAEPDLEQLSLPLDTGIREVNVISFQYPDGNRDAEAMMIDPVSGDIFIISKSEPMVHLYIAPFPQQLHKKIILEFICTLDLSQVTASDISHNGNEILIKTYSDIYYWQRKENETLTETLSREPDKRLNYNAELQGEAIAWALDGSTYFTLSEKIGTSVPKLFLYNRE